MPLHTISLKRPLNSYAKVQGWIGTMIRNRRFQLGRPRVRSLRYLDVGCGPNTHAGLINLDYLWRPGVDVCWNIQLGLPFADGSLQGVFSEHCLEHFPLPAAMDLLREMRRVLSPGGVLRLVVPDGELYLRTYVQHLDGKDGLRFPYQEHDSCRELWTPMMSVNRIFYQDRESLHGHRTIFDFQMMQALLRECGFTQVARRNFRQGTDPQLLVDTPSRQVESLYVEAQSAPPSI